MKAVMLSIQPKWCAKIASGGITMSMTRKEATDVQCRRATNVRRNEI